MSGSPTDGGVGGGTTQVDCADLAFLVELTSPDPSLVAGLVAGTRLLVDLIQVAGFPVAAALNANGEQVGTIGTGNLADLLRCLEQGHPFTATVRTLLGGAVTVLIEAARPS